MRIGVISDTHGQVANTLAAVRMLESLEVQAVLHCGDIGGRTSGIQPLRQLAGSSIPFVPQRGKPLL